MHARSLPRDSAALHYEEARRLVDLGRDAEASKRLDAALAARPNFAEAFSLGGYILERGGKAETAIRFYRRALELKADLLPAWSNLAKLLLKQGAFLDSMRALDEG